MLEITGFFSIRFFFFQLRDFMISTLTNITAEDPCAPSLLWSTLAETTRATEEISRESMGSCHPMEIRTLLKKSYGFFNFVTVDLISQFLYLKL